MIKKCVIIFSGGLDSTTVLAFAIKQGFEVYALTFNYKQRNKFEIEYAKKTTKFYNINHKIFDLDLEMFGGSSLTNQAIEVTKYKSIKDIPKGVQSSYVPARNIIFLSLALSYAETVGAQTIFYGANKLDVDNYPDCTIEFLDSFQKMANIGTKSGNENNKIEILAPLITMTKNEIIKLGILLNVDYSNTISCYDPSPLGKSCGRCMSCTLRLENFKKLGLKDPIVYV